MGLLFLVLYLLGISLFPVIYPYELHYGWSEGSWGWYFVNRDEKDKISNLYGDEGWRRANNIVISELNYVQRWYIAFRWIALRNPHWNAKMVLVPKKGKLEDLTIWWNNGDGGATQFRNHTLFGSQCAFFTKDGQRQFRLSVSIPVKLLWIWEKQWIVQMGYAQNRYIYKNKWSDR